MPTKLTQEALITLLSEAAQLLNRMRDNEMDDADWPRVDGILCDIADVEAEALVGSEFAPV